MSSNSSRIASRCRPEKTFLLVAVFVVSLMVIGGAADVQHAGELEQVVASDHTPYHLTGGAWSILDLSAPQSGYAFAQTPDTPPAGAFVTTWKTTSDNEIITFPANGTYTIDWGDGSSPSLNVENVQDHTYATAGNYTVKISGGLHAIDLSLNGRDNAAKLQSIEQWGNIEWSTMNSAFRDASNMVYNADDAPDLSGVTDMSNMFNGASSFNGDLSSWNVSSVTDMSDMFNGASSFNGDLASWNVSSVTSMSYMFYDASVFNGDLSSWDISSVNYMTYMFNGASSFDQNLGNWYVVPADTAYVIAENTLKVTTISAQNAFLDDHLPSYGIGSGNNNSNLFNITDSNILMLKSVPPAGTYNVNVTASGVDFFEDGDNWRLLEIIVMTVDPENLVENRFVTTWKTTSANESITIPAIGSYTVRWSSSDVASEGASNSTSHVYPSPGTHTVSIHGGLEAIDLSGDSTNAAKLQSIEQWGNIEWNTMNSAFRGADNMVYNAGDAPDLSGVTDISGMFAGASSFNGNLSSWNVSSVTDMSGIFNGASSFNGNLSSWNVSSVTDMSGIFNGASSFNGNLSSWDVSSVTDMSGIFNGASSSFNGNLSSWDVSSVTDMSGIFNGASSSSFNGDLSRWNVSSVTDMSFMFYNASSFNGDLSRWDVSSVENMSYMFYSSSSFNGDLSRWDVSSVENMSYMFYSSSSFNGDLSNWSVSSVTDMSSIFNGASSFNGDLSRWDVSSVTNMDHMFRVATSFDQNLGNWYIVPADTAYDNSEGTLNVTTISAQNTVLDNHPPLYRIGSGENSNLFNITDSNTLMLKSSPLTGTYIVKVTASGTVFENGNNWRLLEIEVTGQTTDTTPPVITVSGLNSTSVPVLGPYSDAGATCVDGVHRNLTVTPESNVDIGAPGTYTVTYSCTDFAGNEATATRTVTVTGDPVENHFVTTWRTTSANESIRIPASDGPYTVKWSNDTAFETLSGSQAHVYPSPGNYTVRIYGNLGSIDLSLDSNNAAKLQSIEQWGNIEWDTMNSAFRGASNMVYNAADAPDLSGVDDLSSMFSSTSDFNGDLSNWNVSSVTDMSFMFYNASAFNGDLSSWNVSSVTDMPFMFYAASSFNRPLASWDVSSVENMSFMFSGASSFDQNLGNWYVVPADTTYAISEGTLNVTTISTQNVFLDSNFPSYGIGSGSNNSTLFNITNSNTLMFKGAPSVDTYNVNVTASGTYVFADGNNWRVFAVSVSDDINALPVLTAIGPKSVNETVLLEFNAAATDADNNALSFSLETGYPSGASITSAGEFSWTPTERQDGTSSITIKVSDNKNGTDSDTFTVTVNEVDTAPVLDTITSKDVTRPNTLTFTATASDDDYRGNVTDTVTFSLTGPPLSGASITSAGDFSWTPTANQTGLHDVTVTVTDGTGLTDSKDVAITVTDTVNTPPTTNRPPTADAGSDLSVDEGGSITLQGSGSDPDGNDSDLTYLWSQSPAAPVISFDNQNSATPEITAPPVTAETEITLTLRVDDGTDHATDTMVLTIQDVTPANQAPSADAGNDRQVDEGGSITLQGSGSDPDGNDSDLTYLWSQSPAAPVISFDNRTSATPEITAPSVTAETEITLTLRVDDGTDHATDTMVLTIQDVTPVNQAPSADAGNDRQVDEGGSITLQGSGSDPDGNDSDLTYSWSQSPAAPVISFDNRTSATPEITAPSVTAETEITLTLRVDDGTDHATDTMVLTIRDVTVATVNVGPDQTVKEGATVIMPWTASGPDGESLTYSWQQSPAQPHIILNNTDSSRTTFTVPDVDADTAFTFTLVVTAGQHTVEDSLTITVKNNRPPTVDAGANRTVNERTAVTLSGSASDPDGDTMTYAWTHDSGISVDLTGSDTTRPQFTAPGVTSNEDIVFTFTVKDTASESADDTVTVTVRDVSISVLSATYNPGNGQLIITFNQDIGPSAPDYSAMHIRSTGSDSGGIALSGVTASHTS